MPFNKAVLAGVLLAISAWISPHIAVAQNPRPALSPWLNYFRSDVGVLPRYQQFVQPRIELQRELTRQNLQLQRQQRQIRSVGQGLNQFIAGETRPTGVQAGFMNYSHYYQVPRVR